MSTSVYRQGARPADPELPRRRLHGARERRDESSRSLLVRRVLSEFREMPCLRVTAAQAQRLFGLRADVSARIIQTLIAEGHLRLDSDGRYAASEPS